MAQHALKYLSNAFLFYALRQTPLQWIKSAFHYSGREKGTEEIALAATSPLVEHLTKFGVKVFLKSNLIC